VRRRAGAEGDSTRASIELRDGGMLEVDQAAPGWEQFLAAAEDRLPGMRLRSDWAATPPLGTDADDEILFMRTGPTR
jgi:hypothetical protein